MATQVFTRSQLYDLIWAEPMRTVAARLGISDVGLAKACRREGIPVPERGYWAKLQAGKSVCRPPLPETNGPDQVVLAPAPPRPPPSAAAQAVLDNTPVPAIAVPADLKKADPVVQEWVRKNTEHRRRARRDGWALSRTLDLDQPLQERRLRLYSALFRALREDGLQLSAGPDPDAWSTVSLNGEGIEFRIYIRSRQVRRPLTAEEKQWSWNAHRKDGFDLVEAGDLNLKINTYTRNAMPELYRETRRPLDDQLGEIAVAFRVGLAELRVWRREREDDAERWRRAEQVRAERAQREREAQAWRDDLAARAGHWRQAQDIRGLVEAVAGSGHGHEPAFAAWRAAALAAADRLDPVAGGRLDLRLPVALEIPDAGDPIRT